MIRQLIDPANAITATGLVLSTSGIYATLSGHPGLGVAIVLWALLADHLDGVVASRTAGRLPETGKVGKSLDSLADLVSAGVFPAVLLITVSEHSPAALITGALLVVASALRLSYFGAFGMPDGRFIGVPTTYAVPAVTVVFLLGPLLPPESFPWILNATLLVTALLHVAPVRVPATAGAMYAIVTLFCMASSALLISRHVW